METFIDQVWVALMSAFIVLAFLAVMIFSIWLVKIVAEKLLHHRPARNTHPGM